MYQLWWDRSWVGKKHIRNSIETVERHIPRPQPYPRKNSQKKSVREIRFPVQKKQCIYEVYIFRTYSLATRLPLYQGGGGLAGLGLWNYRQKLTIQAQPNP